MICGFKATIQRAHKAYDSALELGQEWLIAALSPC